MLCVVVMAPKRYKELKNLRPGDFIVEYNYDCRKPQTFIVIQNIDVQRRPHRGFLMQLTLLGRTEGGNSAIFCSKFNQDRLFRIVNIDKKSK